MCTLYTYKSTLLWFCVQSYVLVVQLLINEVSQIIYHKVVVVFNVLDYSTTVHRENFSVDVQSMAVGGDSSYSVAVNIAVGEYSWVAGTLW